MSSFRGTGPSQREPLARWGPRMLQLGPQDAATQAGSSLPRPSYPGTAAYSSVNRLSAVPTGGASLPQATPLTPRGLGDLQVETKAAAPSAASGGTRTELLRDARAVGLASH